MHLALLSYFDAYDVRTWSGIPNSVLEALRKDVGIVSMASSLDVSAAYFRVPSMNLVVDCAAGAEQDGVNGLMLPARATPQAIAERILAAMNQPEAYRSLARGARQQYEQRLNWSVGTKRIVEQLEGLVA